MGFAAWTVATRSPRMAQIPDLHELASRTGKYDVRYVSAEQGNVRENRLTIRPAI